MGNTDEMLFRPASFTIMPPIQEMAAWTRERLGEERLAWLRGFPLQQDHGEIGLVHASPESCWRSPVPTASDEELETVFAPLGKAVVAYGHVHHPFVRRVGG
jgi:hypothetical protein